MRKTAVFLNKFKKTRLISSGGQGPFRKNVFFEVTEFDSADGMSFVRKFAENSKSPIHAKLICARKTFHQLNQTQLPKRKHFKKWTNTHHLTRTCFSYLSLKGKIFNAIINLKKLAQQALTLLNTIHAR